MQSPPRSLSSGTESRVSFSPEWTTWSDTNLTQYVKNKYSPKESWKNKPFTELDANFFFKGINELSDLFTEDRPLAKRGMPSYFRHPKYRSAYLLYFLPLQAAKFFTLFELHPEAMQEAAAHGIKTGCLRLLDLGSGPATASIAALFWFVRHFETAKKTLPPIEIHLIDTDKSTMQDGRALIDDLKTLLPSLAGKVKIITTVAPWWNAPRVFRGQASLILMGHVLNEAVEKTRMQSWIELMALSSGGGVLIVDLASRKCSQLLSFLRDLWLEEQLISDLWGPCLHLDACPMAEGRDWCHFSMPTRIPGQWFAKFSRALGSERLWLKMSYLWVAKPDAVMKELPREFDNIRRVISDPLGDSKSAVLLCEPREPLKYSMRSGERVFRGDLVDLSDYEPSTKKPRRK